jgi:site-specific DNA recombinase
MTKKAAIYLRISLDQTGEGLAVERQRQDCEAIAKAKGFQVVEIYSDSVSAFKKSVYRPNYERMISDYLDGRFEAVICWDLDRLTRQVRQLEDWIEWATDRGLALITANGEADLTTDGGRMYATIKVAVARAEMDRKSARQTRALQQRAELGRPPKGTRLTGYEINGDLVEAEAKLIAEIFARFSTGETLKGLTRSFNDSGIPSRNGAKWNPSTIRGILTNGRYCGRSMYKGQSIGSRGTWEPIVSEAMFDLVQARLGDPARVKNRTGTERKHLGSGLFECSECNKKLRTNGNRYWCPEGGHVLRTQSHIDEFVLALVAARLNEKDVVERMTDREDLEQQEVEQESQNLQNRLKTIEADYDAGLIDGLRFKTASGKIQEQLNALHLARNQKIAGRALALALSASDPGKYFLEGTLAIQRSIIDALLTVTLKPGTQGQKGFKPNSISWTWKVY